MTLDEVLARLEQLTGRRPQRNGNGWRTLCPLHQEPGNRGRASLSVSEEDGKLLLHCFAECSSFDELMAVVRGVTAPRGSDTRSAPDGTDLPDEFLWSPAAHRRWREATVHVLLEEPDAPGVGQARRYLRNRGITSADCRRLGIGFYSPPAVGEAPPPLSGESRHDLARVAYMIVFTPGPTSVEGRIVEGLEVHVHPDVRRMGLDKSYAAGPKRWWGVKDVTDDYVAVVEGWADRVAMERVEVPTVAARGQSTSEPDVVALAHAGVKRAYLALDADAKESALQRMARVFTRHGITPVAMFGHQPSVHPGKDLGDLLKHCSEDELWEIVYGHGTHRNIGVLCDAAAAA